jgi:hypothetical protein
VGAGQLSFEAFQGWWHGVRVDSMPAAALEAGLKDVGIVVTGLLRRGSSVIIPSSFLFICRLAV